jgi:sugar phosphate isomerase/epimerase
MIDKALPPLELCWGVSPDASLIELAEAAAANGYASITLSPFHYRAARAAGMSDAQLQSLLAGLGIAVGVLDPVGISMPGARPIGAVPAYYKRFLLCGESECLDIAQTLGAPTINVSNTQCDPVSFGVLIERVGAIAERAARRGLTALVEFQPAGNVSSLDAACRLVRSVGADRLRIMFDSWHFARLGGSLTDLAAVPEHWFGGLQLSDRIEPPPGQAYVPMSGRLLPGDGQLPLRAMLQVILERNPTLRVGAEIFNAELAAMEVGKAAGVVADAFRRLFRRSGD